MRYLDPKADLTFKKVFGERPKLVMSLLNALLPLKEGEEIEAVEYLSPEQVPVNPARKNSIVDVRCRDKSGRQFIVEMQMSWSTEYKRRVLFNAAKAYVSQLDRGSSFSLLQPVYSLNLVNDTFEPEPDEYYHYYSVVHEKHSDRIIDGLHLVFVELPKFTPQSYSDKRMQVLWLRFLTEINEKTETVPQELLDEPDVKEALQIVEESSYTKDELYFYDRFWDSVRVENALMNEAENRSAIRYKEGLQEGLQKGLLEGMLKGREDGIRESQLMLARTMKSNGYPASEIAKLIPDLSIEELDYL